MQKYYNKKRKLNKLKASLLLLMLMCFAGVAKAQTNVYMHSGTQNVTGTLNFYDSGGPESPDGSYFWEKQYSPSENSTLTFKDGSNKIQITFKTFQGWSDSGWPDYILRDLGDDWSARLNDDYLYIYDGESANDENLIVQLTGNIKNAFTITANGPLTVKFVSNNQYNGEGWSAEVKSVGTASVINQPIISKDECGDFVNIYNTAIGSTVYYTTNGNAPDPNDPLTNAQLYQGPISIDLSTQNASVTVKAISFISAGNASSPSTLTLTHDDQRPIPGKPTVTQNGNMVTMKPATNPGLDETYNVVYTTDGTEPDASNGTVITAPWNPIEWHTPNVTFKVATLAVKANCNSLVSEVVELEFGDVTVPTPVIAFEGTGATGTATITCGFDQATIYYTTDGSQPNVSNVNGNNGPTYIYSEAFEVTAGTTVKAYANYAQDHYLPSAVASAVYVPSNGSGTYGGLVLLDDREDHSWSYYSDNTNPIRSLNPADVKITYYGNGTNTVATSNNANPGNTFTASTNNSVQVSYNETESTFIYLKTLERADGATSQNPTGNCAYTTIPNPFSKRPTYETGDTRWRGFYGWRVKSVTGGSIQNYAVGATIPAETEIQFVPAAEYGMEVELEALWARAYVVTTGGNNSNTAISSQNVGYERNFVVLAQNQNYYFGGNTSPRISNTGYAATISRRYPDGTLGNANATVRPVASGQQTTYAITLGADTKFEFLGFYTNNNFTLTAAGNDLIIGRGVSGTVNIIQGLSANATNNFNLRIESGTYANIHFMGSYGLTTGGKLTSILGSDYDRANNTNTNLRVTTDIVLSHAGKVGSLGTQGTERFHCTVKSGNFDMGGYGGDHQFYLSTPSGSMYAKRSLIIEGGVFSDIAGGIEAQKSTINAEMVNIRIKGGTINGAVFGAAQFAGSAGDRRFVITGGDFKGWIAGGCNGTKKTGGELYGNTYIYFGGKANCDSNGSSTTIGSGQATGGNIFGAGSGNSGATGDNATVGRVNSSTIVIADDATVERNVYGGGNYGYVRNGNTNKSDLYVLGGTVQGSVFGGSNMQKGQNVNIWMKDGVVEGNLYGGSNTQGTVNYLATINVSGGTVSNVFGGGYGSSTSMAAGTAVNVSGGTINNNVYGGGEQGSVTGNTVVAISGGTMKNVYGAGLGSEYNGTWPPTAANANISGTTTVNVSGGTMANVYGGGENGSVAYNSNAASTSGKSTVNISNGEVTGTVYGGGQMGTTQGSTTVNVSGGIIHGNVFAGAYGAQQKVYVTGLRTLNITGGHIYSHVYGGSRNANDGNDLSKANSAFSSYTGTEKICVTNISGGTLDENVYAAGYFGNCFGSVYAFIGQNAINNAPNATPTTGITYTNSNLNIGGTIWAGGDWGTFTGTFGNNTISGNSNIYVDGTDYETETEQTSNAQYMNIGGSVLGCGTSCYAGKAERTIIIRNYGYANATTAPTKATRTLFSIQFAKILIFDNANINFTGQGRINSLITTEKYSIYEIYNGEKTTPNADTDVDGVRLVNGSGLFLDAPATQLANFRSMSCENVYASTELNAYTAIVPSTLEATPNKVRVNKGTYVEVKYGPLYGSLIGYAYMMTSTNDADATCAYARPRWESHAAFDQNSGTDNPNDGGWVSYTPSENTFALDGTNPTTNGVQMPYENHTVAKNAEQYFRIWRAGGENHYREGVFNAAANGTATFSYTDVIITLPAFRSNTAYYRFETVGDEPNMSTTVDYGPDVLTFNSALVDDGSWISYNETNDIEQASAIESAQNQIIAQPDVNFGLVAINGQGMGLTTKEGSATSGFIICAESDDFLAEMTEETPYHYVNKFPCTDNTKTPQVTFRLTYYNKLSANMTWEPMTIVLVQCDADGNETDRVTIALAVNTSASIEQQFSTEVYAVMQGKGSNAEQYTAKVVLPQFNLCTAGVESNFKLNSVIFAPANGGELIARGATGGYDYNKFAINYGASLNYDNTDGWNGLGTGAHDTYPMTATNPGPDPQLVGKAGGREQFAIDFTLFYNGHVVHDGKTQLMGTLTYNITFDNYIDSNGDCQDAQELTIIVKVYRRGEGTKFYLDGVNGDNAYPKEDVLARYPNRAAKSLSTIFNRCGYLAGDEIYVVNKVTADKSLIWNGLSYNNVTLYRYNGGHPLASGDGIVGNANNDSYKGELLVANNNVSLRGMTLDGYYEDPFATNNGGKGENPETSVQATAPLITINNGGTVELTNGTVLQNNYNNGNGGAVYVDNGGLLKMNQNAMIKDNVATGNGAGVYMAGTMIVSDNVKIVDNMKGNDQNNVNLTAADKVITIGTAAATDQYGELGDDAEIGVTKELYGDVDGYTKVVNVETDINWLEKPYNDQPNSIIYHDLGKYQLEKYNDPTYLYWIGTWVTVQDWNPKYPSATAEGYNANDFDPSDINTPEELAWFISHVNGLNGANPHPTAVANVTADLDMGASIWVPIGSLTNSFQGTFEGNGHVIKGMYSPLTQTNMGMIGNAEGATVQNVIANVTFEANAANMGTLIGSMTGGTLSNVEAAGSLVGGSNTINMGGLVGIAQPLTVGETTTKPTIHSAFAVNEMTGATSTVMGGLVGSNGADLYNSYANVTMTGSNTKGGLVGVNNEGCTVENCYVVLGQQEYPAFAYTNKGSINYCYVDKAGAQVGDTEGSTGSIAKSGTYAAVKGRKELGYMYSDNIVTAPAENTYANHEAIEYLDNHTLVWNGLLSVLNQWVADGHTTYTKWLRPTSADINGDLPVLAFAKDNAMATIGADKKYLQYSAFNLAAGDGFDNGIDGLLATANVSNIFLYGNATKVANVPATSTNVFINEDAVLVQADGAGDFINTTVGVTFDNSDHGQNATDWLGHELGYDWHMMSTPLSDAAFGATYGTENGHYGDVNITKMEGGYFPDGLSVTTPAPEGTVMWDFYTYYEPEYHWINFKRTDHWHVDNANQIQYNEADQRDGIFTPGKGYMMAISQDSYMNSTGTLNNGDVTIALTNQEPEGINFNK
ncbi:MAG: FN3 associated domain-containing protein, partial [bacterium]|nr:FN3 associated domain-containing protein [bacterium]